jgi:hypothetical protein
MSSNSTERGLRGGQGGGAADSSATERLQPLLAGSGFAAWKPKAKVFLGLKGLKGAISDTFFPTEKMWQKAVKLQSQWAAEDARADWLEAGGGDSDESSDDEFKDHHSSDGSRGSDSLEDSSSAAAATQAGAGRKTGGKKFKAAADSVPEPPAKPLSDKVKLARKNVLKMVKESEQAHGFLHRALPPNIQDMVETLPPGWAYGLWRWLEKKYLKSEAADIGPMLVEWGQMQMTVGESWDTWKARVDSLRRDLKYAGEEPNERLYESVLVNVARLQPDYHSPALNLKTSILRKPDYSNIDWDEISDIMNQHEKQIQQKNAAADSAAQHAKVMALQQQYNRQLAVQHQQQKQQLQGQKGAAPTNSNDNNNYGSGRQGSSGDKGNYGEHMRCWRCDKVGHVKANCPNKPKFSPNNNGAAGGGGSGQQRQEQVAAVFSAAAASSVQPQLSLETDPEILFAATVHAPAWPRQDAAAKCLQVASCSATLELGTGTGHRVKSRWQKQMGIDTMASVGVSGVLDLFLELEPCEPILVKGMDGGILEVALRGRLELHLDSNGRQSTEIVKDVYYHPQFALTLLSMVRLSKCGWKLQVGGDRSSLTTPHGHEVALNLEHHVSMLHCMATVNKAAAAAAADGNKREVFSLIANGVSERVALTQVDELVQLHRQLNHMGFDRMMNLLEVQATEELGGKPSSAEVIKQARAQVLQCTACAQGKGTRTAFGHRGIDKGTADGEVLHLDSNYVKVMDPAGKIQVWYGLNVSDSFSGARFKEHLQSKDQIPQAVINIFKRVQRQSDWKVKRIYADGGSEFNNSQLKGYCLSEGIELHWPPKETQQLNGKAERDVRTGKDQERTMLLQAGLPAAAFFKHASRHAVHVWNRTYVSPHTGRTPFEALYKRKPSAKHWGVFGCDAYHHLSKKDRIATYDPKMLPCIYLGHDGTQNCAVVLDLESGKLVFTRDVKYHRARFTHATALRGGGDAVRAVLEAGYTEDESPVPAGAVEPLELDDGEWAVESIVGKRRLDGHLQYEVRWTGFDETTWEPLDNLDNVANLIDKFEAQQQQQQRQLQQQQQADDNVAAGTGPEPGPVEVLAQPVGPVAQPAAAALPTIAAQPAAVVAPQIAVQSGEPVQIHHDRHGAAAQQASTAAAEPPAAAATVSAAPEPAAAANRRSGRNGGHSSSRAHDACSCCVESAAATKVNVSGAHVHRAMAALSSMQPGGEMTFTEPVMVGAVTAALAQMEAATPSSWKEAMQSPEREKWIAAARKEMASIEEMEVWDLVPRASVPKGQIVIACKWVFKIKTDEHGAVTVYKARLTPKGFMQRVGINVYETFAATGKYKSMRIGMSIAAAHDYELDQMDVPVAFQHPELEEEVYMEVPEGFREGKEHLVCRLRKALYGLKQGPRNWWLLITRFLTIELGFKATVSDPCLFFKRSRSGRLLLLFLFVDDMQIGYHLTDLSEWSELKAKLVDRFNTKDMGPSTWILGMRIKRNRKARTLTLDQELYVTKALERYGMQECKPVSTPEVVGSIGGDEAEMSAPADLQLFQEMVGTLMYAAISCRLDIAHAVHALASDMQAPTGRSMLAARRVLRYLAGTKDIGLTFGSLASGNREPSDTRGRNSTLVDVCAFADADWANSKKDRKSITGWVAKLNGDPISWASKKQRVVALSTCEAELYAEAAALQEVLWLRDLVGELGLHVHMGSLIYGDNQATIAVSKNGVKADRTKHVDIKYHFVTQTVESGDIRLKWIPTTEQQADIFTKALAAPVFELLRKQLMTR